MVFRYNKVIFAAILRILRNWKQFWSRLSMNPVQKLASPWKMEKNNQYWQNVWSFGQNESKWPLNVGDRGHNSWLHYYNLGVQARPKMSWELVAGSSRSGIGRWAMQCTPRIRRGQRRRGLRKCYRCKTTWNETLTWTAAVAPSCGGWTLVSSRTRLYLYFYYNVYIYISPARWQRDIAQQCASWARASGGGA